MTFSPFTANDFLACNGTLVGARHLRARMEHLRDCLVPVIAEKYPDLAAVVSPLYTSASFQPNRDRPRDHACVYFVDRALKKSPFPRLPQLGVYLHRHVLSVGFYSGWWTREAMQRAIADRRVFRGAVPRKGYRCLAGDIIVEAPGHSVSWSPSRLDGVDRSLFVGKIFTPDEVGDARIAEQVAEIFDDLYGLYRIFVRARQISPGAVVYEVAEAGDAAVVRDALSSGEAGLLCDLHRYMAFRGFRIAPDMLFNLYLCLKARPFLILSGISGTGKSSVVRLMAEAVNGVADGRAQGYRLIPVRPDWHDVRDLVGYEHVLTGVYRPGALLLALREAQADPDRPYFACLDEMNLARVEHYFADFLSVMETARRTPDGEWTTDLLELGGEGVAGLEEARMPIPPNFFVVGTVNVDETTYAFSPKVLDRANAVLFDEMDLAFPEVEGNGAFDAGALRDLGQALLDRPYRQFEDVRHRADVAGWNDVLIALNEILSEVDLPFAYRVRDGVLVYMAYALDLIEALPEDAPAFAPQDAFDYQVLQKVLPRLSGGAELEEALEALYRFCEKTYPRSARKLDRMRRRLAQAGFVSFW